MQYHPLQDLFLLHNLIYYYYFVWKLHLKSFYNALCY